MGVCVGSDEEQGRTSLSQPSSGRDGDTVELQNHGRQAVPGGRRVGGGGGRGITRGRRG